MPTATAAVPPQWQAVARFYGAILCIGLGVGLLAAGFHAALDALAAARHWMSTQDTGLANSFLDRLGVTPFRLQSWMISALGGALLSTAAVALVRRFAPDTAGSGIPEVVATLRGLASLNWRRVLPVKFVAGVLGIGSGMVLGREGPTIHLGATLGALCADLGMIARRDRLIAITAGAGARAGGGLQRAAGPGWFSSPRKCGGNSTSPSAPSSR